MVYGFAFDKRVQPDDHIVAILGKRPHTEVIVNLEELRSARRSRPKEPLSGKFG